MEKVDFLLFDSFKYLFIFKFGFKKIIVGVFEIIISFED